MKVYKDSLLKVVHNPDVDWNPGSGGSSMVYLPTSIVDFDVGEKLR